MRNPRDANVRFDIEGGPFEWWKFDVPSIEGRLDWVGEKLALRNVHAEFYGGTAVGEADFDFTREKGGRCLMGKAGRQAFYDGFEALAAPLGRLLRRMCRELAAELRRDRGSL